MLLLYRKLLRKQHRDPLCLFYEDYARLMGVGEGVSKQMLSMPEFCSEENSLKTLRIDDLRWVSVFCGKKSCRICITH